VVQAVALVCEVADVLARHGGLTCTPDIDTDQGDGFVLCLRVAAGAQATSRDAMGVLELLQDLQRALDVAQLRALAVRYGIDPARLEALLPGQEG
jgi:hypothetical protein